MKLLVKISVVLAVVAFVLGVIDAFVPKEIIFEVKWNDLCQTFLLFALSFGVWDYVTKK